MSTAQAWSLIGLLGTVLLALIGSTTRMMSTAVDGLRAEIGGLLGEMCGEFGGLRGEMIARFDSVDRQLDGIREATAAQFEAARDVTNARFDAIGRNLERLEEPPPGGQRRSA
jgi:hypothetical protein